MGEPDRQAILDELNRTKRRLTWVRWAFYVAAVIAGAALAVGSTEGVAAPLYTYALGLLLGCAIGRRYP